MAELEHIPTVFDIACEAGVSRGTVDRVIHRRGRYSEETARKVMQAIEKLGYTTNANAANLATKKSRTIACLIPSFNDGEYWHLVYQGLRDGSPKSNNVNVEFFLYDQNDIASYKECCGRILESAPSGVITNAVFKDELADFSARMDDAGIPYAFIDNKVDGLGYALYVGIEPYRSGELGAYLLTLTSAPDEVALVRILRDKGHHGDPNEPRRNGFLDYMAANFPTTEVHTVFIDPSDPVKASAIMEDFHREHPAVRHFATTNSRIHLITPFLKAHPGMTAVGFDDLEKNLAALKEGCVDFLVTHRIQDQARLCVNIFSDFIVRGALSGPKNRYVHLDILTKMNLDDYNG